MLELVCSILAQNNNTILGWMEMAQLLNFSQCYREEHSLMKFVLVQNITGGAQNHVCSLCRLKLSSYA